MDHLTSLNLNSYAPQRAADLRLSTGSPDPSFERLATLTIWTGAVSLSTYPDAATLRALAAGATAAADALEPQPGPLNADETFEVLLAGILGVAKCIGPSCAREAVGAMQAEIDAVEQRRAAPAQPDAVRELVEALKLARTVVADVALGTCTTIGEDGPDGDIVIVSKTEVLRRINAALAKHGGGL